MALPRVVGAAALLLALAPTPFSLPAPPPPRDVPPAGSEPPLPTHPLTVTGTVTDGAGRPLAGAKVFLFSRARLIGGRNSLIVSTNTDKLGRYTFTDAPLPVGREVGIPIAPGWERRAPEGDVRGLFQVAAVTPGRAFAWHWPRYYVLNPAPAGRQYPGQDACYFRGESVVIDLRLGPEAPLRGRLLDEDGQPHPDVELHLGFSKSLAKRRDPEGFFHDDFEALQLLPPEWTTARTDAQGRFAFAGLPADEVFRVWFKYPGCEQGNSFCNLHAATTDRPIPADIVDQLFPQDYYRPVILTGDVNLKLPRLRTVALHLITAKTHRPAAGVEVSARPDGGRDVVAEGPTRPTLFVAGGTTDADGRLVLRLVPAKYAVYLRPTAHPEPVASAVLSLTVRPTPTEQSAELEAPRGCRVTFTALDADTSKGVAGVQFAFHQANGETYLPYSDPIFTDTAGRLVIAVPPGSRCRVEPRPPHGYRMAEADPVQTADLPEGGSVELRFRLREKK